MTQFQIDQIDEYSMSIPTGTTLGKRWKRNLNVFIPKSSPHWVIGEYAAHDNPKLVAINWYRVSVVKMADLVTPEIVTAVRDFLGEGGVKLFRSWHETYGTWSPDLEGEHPHPVRMREGRQVRDYIQQLTKNSFGPQDYDEVWEAVVEKACSETKEATCTHRKQ